MNTVRRKFLLTAMIAVFVLLTVLLGAVSVVSFTMAANDADRLTERIAGGQGMFRDMEQPREGMQPGAMGPMGPESPEMHASLRYFTVRLDGEEANIVAWNISAVTQEEALQWAQSLSKEGTGWTRGTYRYRVYNQGDTTLVTVIDQGRELLPSYRILLISLCIEVFGLIAAFIILSLTSKKLFAPLEEADRKQRLFLQQAQQEFQIPLTVISTEAELIERGAGGPTESTSSIRRQVRKMTGLTRHLSTLTIYPQEQAEPFDLSRLLEEVLEHRRPDFRKKGVTLISRVIPQIRLTGDAAAMRRVLEELTENALRFAGVRADFSLTSEGQRVRLVVSNDAPVPDGTYEQVFDRFTTLGLEQGEGPGLGLAFVRDAVKAMDGRVSAVASGGEFIVTVSL